MDYLNNISNGQLLAVCLIIFACVLIFPRLIRMKRIKKELYRRKQNGEPITPEDLTGKRKPFYTHNGTSKEIGELLVKLKSYAFKHGMKIICPGTFSYENTVSPTTMILAGNFGLLLIHCYGFGGHIYTEESPSRWMQNMNQTIKEIPNPQQSMEQEKRLMNLLLKKSPFKDTMVYTASVFTRPGIILNAPDGSHIYDRAGFMKWLETDSSFTADNRVPIKNISDYLVELVKGK